VTTPPLRDLQGRLRTLITDPASVTGPLDDLERRVADLPIHGDTRLSPAERVRIYARMYFLRLRDALADDYPALRRALGDDAFDALTQRYVTTHPSDRPSLRDLGRHLPAFLHASDGAATPRWHAELAQLEWAMIEAFDATHEQVLDRRMLGGLAPDEWPALRIAPVCSVRLLSLTTPVDVARERLLASEPAGEVPTEATWLRVWRQDLVVYVRRIPMREMAALRWLHHGTTFAELCGWLEAGTTSDSPDDATVIAAGLLQRWVDDGLLVTG
jgi:hypothetical protein